jgi:hypothetical protein
MAQCMTNAIRHIQSSAGWDNVRETILQLLFGLTAYDVSLLCRVEQLISIINTKVEELDGLEHDWCNVVRYNPDCFSTLLIEVNTAIDEVDKAMTFLILSDRNRQ